MSSVVHIVQLCVGGPLGYLAICGEVAIFLNSFSVLDLTVTHLCL